MSIVGIDLGTTYCCMAALDHNGDARIIRNLEDFSDTLAAAVFFGGADNIIVGNSAKEMLETDSDRVVQYVKRYIGKADAPKYEFDGETYSPVEITALILKRLKQMGESQGREIDKVVISVPAYFGFAEREATKVAGQLAGMDVIGCINEPTAAVLNYCATHPWQEQTVLVYDLGGGAFDVTIVKLTADGEKRKIGILATSGSDRLGGTDWDDVLYNYILKVCSEELEIPVEEIDEETCQLIQSRVEVTKKRLTNADSARVKVSVNGMRTNITVTREEFEKLASEKVSEAMSYVEEALHKAGDIPIDTVLLTGGSAQMPMIICAMEERFPQGVITDDSDFAVAKGAALYAGMLQDGGGDEVPAMQDAGNETGLRCLLGNMMIDDVISRSIGLGIKEGSESKYVVDNLIKTSTSISEATAVKTYYTPKDNAEKMVLCAFESKSNEDRVVSAENSQSASHIQDTVDAIRQVGEVELTLPPNLKANSPIEITFRADDTNLIFLATNPENGEAVSTSVKFVESLENYADSHFEDLKVWAE